MLIATLRPSYKIQYAEHSTPITPPNDIKSYITKNYSTDDFLSIYINQLSSSFVGGWWLVVVEVGKTSKNRSANYY